MLRACCWPEPRLPSRRESLVRSWLGRRTLREFLGRSPPRRCRRGVPTIVFLDDHHANHAADRQVGRQEGLVAFDTRLSIDRAVDGLPAALLSGALDDAELVLAVLPRPASPAVLRPRWHIAQRRVFAQPADDDDEPHGSFGLFQERNDPFHQPRCQLQLGGESRPTTVPGDRRDRPLADLQQRQRTHRGCRRASEIVTHTCP